MTSLEEINRLRRVDSRGRPLLVPVAELTLYWRGSIAERSAALEGVVRRMLGDIGPALRFFETGEMAGGKPLRTDTLETIPFWLRQKHVRPDIYWMRLESGAKRDDPSDQALLFLADEEDDVRMGALRLALPPAVLVERPEAFVDRVAYYVGDLAFESGHAGFGINWDQRGEDALEAKRQEGEIAARFHGVDFFNLDVTLVAMRLAARPVIKRAGWLTLLGSDITRQLGGERVLASSLPSGCRVRPLSLGLVVQAGPEPTIGGPIQHVDLQYYKAVGELLEPWRVKEHENLFSAATPSGENGTALWLSRFDRT